MNKGTFLIAALGVSAVLLTGCSTQPQSGAETTPSPTVITSSSTAAPTASSSPSASNAKALGVTEEQLKKITDKSNSPAAVDKFTEATCKTYASGGDLTDVIREQAGVVLTSTQNLTPDRKLFFGALASVAGDKIEQNCPEYTDEFTADSKALLSR